MSVSPFAHLLGLPPKKKALGGKKPKFSTPDKRSAKPASFSHLAAGRRAGGRIQEDDTDRQEPTIPCEQCRTTGQFGGKECPACDGEGFLTVQQAGDQAADFVKEFQNAQQVARGQRTPAGAKLAKPTGFAAEVIAAGKKARGEKS